MCASCKHRIGLARNGGRTRHRAADIQTRHLPLDRENFIRHRRLKTDAVGWRTSAARGPRGPEKALEVVLASSLAISFLWRYCAQRTKDRDFPFGLIWIIARSKIPDLEISVGAGTGGNDERNRSSVSA
jgi:hypothetical protein